MPGKQPDWDGRAGVVCALPHAREQSRVVALLFSSRNGWLRADLERLKSRECLRDVDSDQYDAFDEVDQQYLEQIMAWLARFDPTPVVWTPATHSIR
jgi:hypothetical protein